MTPHDAMSDRIPRLMVNTKPAHQVECVAFDPNGRVLASGSRDMNIEIWDVSSRHLLRTLRGHTGIVTALAFDSVGEMR
jgi:WD40 repeat protein